MPAGKLFYKLAILLSGRLSELSTKMRSNVVKAQAPSKAGSRMAPAEVATVRDTFGLPKSAKLLGYYHCSVRHEVNGEPTLAPPPLPSHSLPLPTTPYHPIPRPSHPRPTPYHPLPPCPTPNPRPPPSPTLSHPLPPPPLTPSFTPTRPR